MATALAAGFCNSGLVEAKQISAYDVSRAALDNFAAQVDSCQVKQSNGEVVANSDLVFLALKPQIIPDIVDELKSANSQTTYVSVMGGITLKWLMTHLATERVIRTMPNTPCLIGEGATGVAPAKAVDQETVDEVISLFESVGIAFELPERLIDAVTGISGSGPAFVFQFIEALSDGAVHAGLPRAVALQLAAQTVAGAGKMVLQTGEHPGVLKDRVASPAGTTIAGLKALEENGFRAAAIQAVTAATERSIELGN